MAAYLLPALIAAALMYAGFKQTPVYDAFVEGAREGLQAAVRVLPYLVAVMLLVALLRHSGLMDGLARLLSPLLALLGVPPEVAPLFMVRPLSGAASLAELQRVLVAYGPDSTPGRLASVLMGSSETILYTVGVYLSAAKVRRSRYAIPVALVCSFAAAATGAAFVRLFF